MEVVKAIAAIANFIKVILNSTYHLLFLGLLCLWIGKEIKWVEITGYILVVLAIANYCQRRVIKSKADEKYLLELKSASPAEKDIFRQMIANNSNVFNLNTVELIEENFNAIDLVNNGTVIYGLRRFGQVLLGANQQFIMHIHYWEILLKHQRKILN